MTEHDIVDPALRLYHRAGPQPEPADLALIRGRVLARTANLDQKAKPGLSTRRKLTMAAAGLLVVAGTATALTLLRNDGTTPADVNAQSISPTTNPSEDTSEITNADSTSGTMSLLVKRVANAQPLALPQGGCLYTAERTISVQSANGDQGPAYYVTEELSERWTAVDEGTLPKLVRSTRGLNARPLTDADAVKLAGYGIDYTTVTTSTYDPETDPKKDPNGSTPVPGPTNPTPAYLASLPTDPAALKAVLQSTEATDHQVFKRVSALVSTVDALLSPELRAALYQVVATLPGVERVPGQVDLAGRPGVAVAETDDRGKRHEIVIDPVSSRTIGSRTVLLTEFDGIPAGTVIWTSTTDQSIVTKPGEKP